MPRKSNKIDPKVPLLVAFVTVVGTIAVAIINKIPVPTPTPTPPGITPTTNTMECSINNAGWIEYYIGSLGSTVNVSPVLQTDCEIKIKFDLKKEDWVAAYKKLESNLLLQTQGIRFFYTGTGAANTLEFKLIEKDAEGKETIFYIQWSGATSTARKELSQKIIFSDMPCRDTEGSNCKGGTAKIRPELVDRIDFTISNKPAGGDMPGQGEVTIKGIQIIP